MPTFASRISHCLARHRANNETDHNKAGQAPPALTSSAARRSAAVAASLAPALEPRADVLVRMESGGDGVRAVRAQAQVVRQDRDVVHAGHAEEVHAVRHVLVLAPILGGGAVVPARGPLEQGMVREDLERAEHHVAPRAVDDEHLLADVGAQVGPHAVREQHRVEVGLQREGVASPDPGADDRVPSVDEELRVARGVVHRTADGRPVEADAARAGDGDLAVRGEEGVVVAREDADAPLGLRPGEAHLVAVRPHHREAVQRGEALRGDAVAPRPQLLASPIAVAVVRVRPGGAGAPALGVVGVLLVALHVHAEAAPRLLAALAHR
eukprot:CAMPEP_0176222762 /NCGR_PEP_ID=MMETSP0121_2-20121125/20401_1 /TAXON_ID=160619 /ORGANISM="Kryptoperidinium foliaceum, Strain CCMP 1326" /LENGTH=324 /DNA_ID=CAMNT_0017561985 /DNA_START=309 /DNA_END=1280 /DNA_ORIENTATION=-